MDKQVMKIPEVATYLGFSQRKLYQLVREDKIPVARIGGQYRFLKEEIDAWLRDPKPLSRSNATDSISKIKSIQDINKRRLYLVGLLTKELEGGKARPIVVGGCALEFYTTGGYSTGDVDVIFPHTELLDSVLSKWGFRKEGRHWISSDLDMYIKSPASSLGGGDPARITRVRIEEVDAYVIGVEDLIIDRLNAAVHSQSEDDRYWAKELIYIHGPMIDMDYLRKRASADNVEDEVDKILKEIPHANA